MNGRLHEVRVLGQTLSAEALSARHLAKRELFPEPVKPAEPLASAFGPFVDWVDRSTATITWEVDQSMQGKLRWSMPSGQSAILKTDRLAKRHTVKVTNLVREGEYRTRSSPTTRNLKVRLTSLIPRFIIGCRG